jgi:hypothetical protein
MSACLKLLAAVAVVGGGLRSSVLAANPSAAAWDSQWPSIVVFVCECESMQTHKLSFNIFCKRSVFLQTRDGGGDVVGGVR